MREEPSRKNNGEIRITRRDFLGAGAAVAAVGALGWGLDKAIELNTERSLDNFDRYLLERKRRLQLDKLSTFSPEKREALIDAEIARVREYVLGEEGKRILESGSDDEIWMLITMLPPMLREHITGTKYDVSAKEWPSVVIPRSDTAGPHTVELAQAKQSNVAAFGNGFYMGPNTLVTNWHVLGNEVRDISDRESDRLELVAQQNALDIVYAELPGVHGASAPEPLVIRDTDDSVHASFVTIAGIKPDATAAADGTKLYPAMALRMTPRLADFFSGSPKESLRGQQERAFYKNSFMFVMPPGEAAYPDGRRSPSDGMSGSPVLKSGSLAGMFRSAINGRIGHHGLWYDIGFFHGPDEIKRARDVGLVYNVPR